MARKIRTVLPLLFVLVFAFSLVASLHPVAVASGPCDYLDPRPGCCIFERHCPGGVKCGYGKHLDPHSPECFEVQDPSCPRAAFCVFD